MLDLIPYIHKENPENLLNHAVQKVTFYLIDKFRKIFSILSSIY